MTMRCIFCNRTLQHATVLLAGNPVGPDCARKHNLLGPKGRPVKKVERVRRAPKQQITRDPHTGDLFDELPGSTIAPDG